MKPLQNPSPERKANIFSKLFFCWLFPFVIYGYRNEVQEKDVFDTSEKDRSENLGGILEKNWDLEMKRARRTKKTPSFLKVLIKTYGLAYLRLGFWLFIHQVFLKSPLPYVVGIYIKYFNKSYSQVTTGWGLGVAIIIINMLAALLFGYYFSRSQIFGLKVKAACSSLMYRKVLKLSSLSVNEAAPGELVNLMSNDIHRMEAAAVYINFLFVIPIQTIILFYLTYRIIGISCVPGFLVLAVMALPVQGSFTKFQAKFRLKTVELTGKRLALMSDVISGIHVIKMYAWEKSFKAIVTRARKFELDAMKKSCYVKALSIASVVFNERLTLSLCIITYILLGNTLKSDIIFSTFLCINTTQATLCYYLPQALNACAEIKVTIDRLQKFLLYDERIISTDNFTKTSTCNSIIDLKDVKAGWLVNTLTLTDITLNIKQGTLCCIVGKVGSGKSSFLQLLIKEMPVNSGNVDVTGKISYASQDPWLFVASVKNNILFGQTFFQDKYQEIIKVCALRKDLQQFPHQDQTIIGERGVSLSGGQRARINLARALYLDADIYLLDDPLSAVDAHVSNHLFEEGVMKYLGNKTRILVTHQLQFLKHADIVVVMDQGKIRKIMKKDEVSENSLNQLNEVLLDEEGNIAEKHLKSADVKRTLSNASRKSARMDCEEEQTENEEMESKSISFSTVTKYLFSGTNGCAVTTVFLIFVFGQVLVNWTDMFVMNWVNKEDQEVTLTRNNYNSTESEFFLLPYKWNNSNITNATRLKNTSTLYYEFTEKNNGTGSIDFFNLYVYIGTVLGCTIIAIVRPMLIFLVCLNASRALHKRLLDSSLQAPVRFFETNPSGRILNRFSKDMGSLDEALPLSLVWTVQMWLYLIGGVLIVCGLVPWLFIALVLILAMSYLLFITYLPTLMKLIKLEANSRSPIFSNINSTLDGLATIRSAGAEDMVRKDFDRLLDDNSSTQELKIYHGQMFGFYLEGIWIVFLAVATLQFLRNDSVLGGVIGLVVNQITIIITLLPFGINIAAEVINGFISVERVLQYTDLENEDVIASANSAILMERWPHSGKIIFTNVCLTYVPGEAPVLNNLNLSIRAGEKIGIVGRTGAGKSSLIACLFRLVPIEGTVAIDDIDTATIDLKLLRSKISIIPQEPILFSESLRYNLDPTGHATDETLWRVLENVKLKDAIKNLDMIVSNGGSNFSVGQRQLMCLGRAILRNNRILVMDEATANVDQNTDILIQRTIRENFGSCTVLTIAHRLNTIMDSDRVLVMSLGNAVEFAHPHELLQKPGSYFSEMVRQTGRIAEETLRKIARDDFEKKFFEMY